MFFDIGGTGGQELGAVGAPAAITPISSIIIIVVVVVVVVVARLLRRHRTASGEPAQRKHTAREIPISSLYSACDRRHARYRSPRLISRKYCWPCFCSCDRCLSANSALLYVLVCLSTIVLMFVAYFWFLFITNLYLVVAFCCE